MTTNSGHSERTDSERPLSNDQSDQNLSCQIVLQIQSRCYVRQIPRTDTYKTPGLMPDITGSDKETVTIDRISGSTKSDGRRDVENPYLASDLGKEPIIRQLRNGFGHLAADRVHDDEPHGTVYALPAEPFAQYPETVDTTGILEPKFCLWVM